jgi:hypothetical protein
VESCLPLRRVSARLGSAMNRSRHTKAHVRRRLRATDGLGSIRPAASRKNAVSETIRRSHPGQKKPGRTDARQLGLGGELAVRAVYNPMAEDIVTRALHAMRHDHTPLSSDARTLVRDESLSRGEDCQRWVRNPTLHFESRAVQLRKRANWRAHSRRTPALRRLPRPHHGSRPREPRPFRPEQFAAHGRRDCSRRSIPRRPMRRSRNVRSPDRGCWRRLCAPRSRSARLVPPMRVTPSCGSPSCGSR